MTSNKMLNFGEWMKKTWRKLIVPWICAVLLYLAEGLAFQFLHTGNVDINAEINSILEYGYPIRGWHLWYMYAFTEMYILVPLLKKIKEAGNGIYYFLGLLFLILPHSGSIPWYLIFVKYIGLYIAGDFIFTYCSDLKGKSRIIVCGVFTFSIFTVLIVNAAGVGTQYMSQIKVVAELSTMVFFSNISVKMNLYPVTRHFMTIYILHILVGDFWSRVSRFLHLDGINTWWIAALFL